MNSIDQSDSMYKVKKIFLFQINAVLLTIYIRILKKCITVSTKILNRTAFATLIIIINIYLISTRSAYYNYLAEVMMLKIQLCHHRNKLHFKVCLKNEKKKTFSIVIKCTI